MYTQRKLAALIHNMITISNQLPLADTYTEAHYYNWRFPCSEDSSSLDSLPSVRECILFGLSSSVVYLSFFDWIDDDLWDGAPVVLPVSALGSGAALATDALPAVPQTSIPVLPTIKLNLKHIEVLDYENVTFLY